MKPTFLASAILVALGCGGAPTTKASKAETSIAPEAPVGALKRLAKGLQSETAAERKRAAEDVAKIGPAARPLQPVIKKALEKEADEGVKGALGRAMEKTGGG